MTLYPSRILGTVFLFLAVLSLVSADWLPAAIWAALGSGMVLMEGAIGSPRVHGTGPSRRNRIAGGLLLAALVLFIVLTVLW